MKEQNTVKQPKVNASFKISEQLLSEAKEKCWQERITLSAKIETLIKEWINKK